MSDDIDPGEALAEYGRTRDPLIFERLDRFLRPRAEALARKILRDPGLSADAVQKAIIALEACASKFDPARPFRAFWGKLIFSAIYDQARARTRARERDESAALERPEAMVEDHATRLDGAVLWELLAEAPVSLAPILEDTLLGFTHAEIARRLGRPKGTIDRLAAEVQFWVLEALLERRSGTRRLVVSLERQVRFAPTYFCRDEMRGAGA